jgi:OmpA-OmpF porin, OOP family
MSQKSLLILALLALGLLVFMCIRSHAPMIAAERAAAALADKTSPPAPTATIGAPALTATLSDGKVTLNGAMPNALVRERVVAAAQAAYGVGRVVDDMSVNGSAADASWMPTLPAVFGATKTLTAGELRVEHKAVTVTGVVESEAAKAERIRAVVAAAGAGVAVTDQLTVKPSAPTTPAPAQAQLDQVMLNRVIEFETGRAVLTASGKALLDKVAPIIQSSSQGTIEIGGHTDSRGLASANQQLSEARANAVRDYLIGRGIDGARLKATGYGAGKPIASNNTAAGRQKNRRIEFSVIP